MEQDIANRLLGVGLYSVPEAARIAQVPQLTIRRWLFGHDYNYKNERRHAKPVWTPQFQERLDGRAVVGFMDLIEIQLVHAFREFGLSWPAIRSAAHAARDMYETGHPFASGRFQTDGRAVFLHVAEKSRSPKLIDMCRDQYVFRDVVRDGLKGSLEWMDRQQNKLVRWWPLGRGKQIVIDPDRRFGTPIVAKSGVSTALLAASFNTMKSATDVADWYGVTRREIRDAIEYESRLPA